MSFFTKLKFFQKQIKKKIDKVIELISLHFIFFIGIGLTAIVAKLANKDFLNKSHCKTNWIKSKKRKNLSKMF